MSWVKRAREGLAAGEEVTVRPHGHSMRPKVLSGATVTLSPAGVADVGVGDIVFCKVAGKEGRAGKGGSLAKRSDAARRLAGRALRERTRGPRPALRFLPVWTYALRIAPA